MWLSCGIALIVVLICSPFASAVYTIPSPILSGGRNVSHGNEIIPGAYIVKLASVTEGLGRRELSAIHSFHKRASNIKYSVRHEFTDPSYFFGITVDVYGETNVTAKQKLMAIPNVLSVYPIWKLHRPGQISQHMNETKHSAVLSSKGKRQNTLPTFQPDPQADVLSHLKLCDVDRLHDLGIKGKGMKIAIIDSGVDYRHPSLGGGFGPGYKVGFGAQYVSDDDLLYGPDPLATCAEGGHGTHVSGS